MHTKLWSEVLKVGDHLRDICAYEKTKLKLVLMEQDAMMQSELIWLGTLNGGGLL
jgi:hypothetical protein